MSSTRLPLPPLDPEERWALCINLLMTQGLMLAVGIIASIMLAGFASGDWLDATIGLGWLRAIARSLTTLPAFPTVAIACVAAAIFCVVAWTSERRALRTESGRASVFNSRRGVNGELPRLPLPALVVLTAIIGIAEELVFRFALIGIVVAVLTTALPSVLAVFIGLFVSSVAFWFAHVRYRDLATTVLTLVLGFGLGVLFLATNSLAVTALAHALYDLTVLVIERIQIRRDPDYFDGPAPTRALLDQLEAEDARTAA